MLSAIDHQCGAGNGARIGQITDGLRNIIGRAAFTQRGLCMRVRKTSFGLVTRNHGDAGREPDYAHSRRERLCL